MSVTLGSRGPCTPRAGGSVVLCRSGLVNAASTANASLWFLIILTGGLDVKSVNRHSPPTSSCRQRALGWQSSGTCAFIATSAAQRQGSACGAFLQPVPASKSPTRPSPPPRPCRCRVEASRPTVCWWMWMPGPLQRSWEGTDATGHAPGPAPGPRKGGSLSPL